MDAVRVASRYFDAWNRHDPAAIVAAFHDNGSYADPASGTLSGATIAQYASALFAAFPDLSFDVTVTTAAGRTVAAEWVMRGTNGGPFMGAPPTNAVVALPGVDILAIDDDRIRSVKGYFDQKTLAEQLGLQTVVQPHALGPVRFGTSAYMNGGSPKKPGAFSLTAIHVRSQAEQAEADERGAAILEQLADAPGFISTAVTTIGRVGHTITAWEDAEAPRQFLRSSAHKEAVARFLGADFAAGGMTSVWIPVRINAWVRCTACGEVVNDDQRAAGRRCRCGAAFPAPLPYW